VRNTEEGKANRSRNRSNQRLSSAWRGREHDRCVGKVSGQTPDMLLLEKKVTPAMMTRANAVVSRRFLEPLHDCISGSGGRDNRECPFPSCSSASPARRNRWIASAEMMKNQRIRVIRYTHGANRYKCDSPIQRRNRSSFPQWRCHHHRTVSVITVILIPAVVSSDRGLCKIGARARAETSAEIAAMSAALESYKADNAAYPRDNSGNQYTDNLRNAKWILIRTLSKA